MAKDRFSIYKPENYKKDYFYTPQVNKGRKVLNLKQRDWLLRLYLKTSNQFYKDFISSIIEQNRMPTKKQKEVLIKIKNIYGSNQRTQKKNQRTV